MQSNAMSTITVVFWGWLTVLLVMFASAEERSLLLDRVAGNGNAIEKVRSEANEIAVKLIQGGGSVTIKLIEETPGDLSIKLALSADQLELNTLAPILKVVERFVRLRLEGHSQPFATYLVLHGAEPCPSSTREIRRYAPWLSEEVAFPWLRNEKSAPIAFPLQTETDKYAILYIVDGDIAWVYLVPKKLNLEPHEVIMFRFDAVEFSPAAHPAIQNVFEEMKHEGRVPTLEKSLGSVWWFEFQKRLKQKTGLHWRTPAELNPQTQFD